mmetsp:Transcript_27524/g.61491  ORF Transcript_27524/g.61491 Transcript_27524/m.61491 type:complete len:184 (+) Transcript_27524:136-687(+)
MNSHAPLAFVSGALASYIIIKVLNQRSKSIKRSSNTTPDFVMVTDEKLHTEDIEALVASPKAGAIVSFGGVTRDNFEGKQVVKLEYEGFGPMAEREMLKICHQIRGKWAVERIAIVHRTGLCPVGEASVIIAVSSAHRREAIEATHFAIDTLKATVPIWKKEFYDGESAAWKENMEWRDSRKI